MLTIAVDFDGTIVTHEYPRIGKEIPFAIDTLLKIQKDFQACLILWTVREGKELEEAVQFCLNRGLEFYAINNNYPEEKKDDKQPRKLKADVFIDDRNLGGLPDWGVIYQMIASGDPLKPAPAELMSEYPKKKSGFFSALFGK